MEVSILNTIKKMLGIDVDDVSFDVDIITEINSVFLSLNQLGVGTKDVYHIENKENNWSEFLSDFNFLESVKTYIYIKTRLMFDPPSSQTSSDALDRKASEIEFRLLVQTTEGTQT